MGKIKETWLWFWRVSISAHQKKVGPDSDPRLTVLLQSFTATDLQTHTLAMKEECHTSSKLWNYFHTPEAETWTWRVWNIWDLDFNGCTVVNLWMPVLIVAVTKWTPASPSLPLFLSSIMLFRNSCTIAHPCTSVTWRRMSLNYMLLYYD